MRTDAVIEASKLQRFYQAGGVQVPALQSVCLTVRQGEFVCVMGKSGSGKSTLLNLIGSLDRPDQGTVKIQGRELSRMSDSALAEFRRKNIGFIFQFFNLMPTLTALENVALPLLLDGVPYLAAKTRAAELLVRFELGERLNHRPTQLSGGQMQRVAIARALVAKPALLLADEPTGNLDSHMGLQILGILRELAQKEGQTIVLVTHDIEASKFANRLICMKNGAIESDQNLPQ